MVAGASPSARLRSQRVSYVELMAEGVRTLAKSCRTMSAFGRLLSSQSVPYEPVIGSCGLRSLSVR